MSIMVGTVSGTVMPLSAEELIATSPPQTNVYYLKDVVELVAEPMNLTPVDARLLAVFLERAADLADGTKVVCPECRGVYRARDGGIVIDHRNAVGDDCVGPVRMLARRRA